MGLRDLGQVKPEISETLRYGFHIPVAVMLDGRVIPGYAVHHHLAHAANSFYTSEFDEAAIMTHDGFGLLPGYHSGMYYLGRGEAIFPLWPHHLTIGYLYEYVANTLGLGVGGGSGKLMGLAPYGQPTFFNQRFVGNVHDFKGKFRDVSESWVTHCRRGAKMMGYDDSLYADPTHATAPINADIAASTQRLFEITRLEAVRSLKSQLQNANSDVSMLCLSGGTALNCPSNSDIAASGLFRSTYVDPACDDGGIAIGAALAAYHNILGYPRSQNATLPYLGKSYSTSEVDAAISTVIGNVTVKDCVNPAESAALDLQNDQIVGWFEGGSECGPRALGHRSILADPRRAHNWSRLNRVKRREPWRPFAPAVLMKYTDEWFEQVPLPAPYMLFNAIVRGTLLPAVTHVDGTARIQTVDESCGDYFRLIEEFHLLTGIPVVVNTSLNGPGEPLVETPKDALEVFLSSDIDVLYLDGRRVVRSLDSLKIHW
jgi:carbamoyltransferase